jgi:hypothetical protein
MTPAEKYGLKKPTAPWGRDGNTMFIAGAVRRALKDAGYPPEAVEEFSKDILSGGYDHALQTAMLWCDEGDPEDEDEDELWTCANCGLEDYPSRMKKVSGRTLCEDCALDSEMCEECGQTKLYCEC